MASSPSTTGFLFSSDLCSCSNDSSGEEGPVILDVLLGHRESPDRRHPGPTGASVAKTGQVSLPELDSLQSFVHVSLVTLHHNPLVSSETLLLSSDPAMIHLGEFWHETLQQSLKS